MKKIPQDFPIHRLIGSSLEKICISVSSTAFLLDSGDSITSYVEDCDLLFEHRPEIDQTVQKIASIVGKNIDRAMILDGIHLILKFSNGIHLRFTSSVDGDYSYSMYIGGQEYLM